MALKSTRTFAGLALAALLAAPLRAQDSRDEESRDYVGQWVKTDVKYIISAEELEILQKLTTDEEKERFIEAFWKRRDPTPTTLQNEFKEEHYRRIAYANDHFSAGLPGWLTDRGRIYIKYGPPAQIDVYPTGTSLTDYRGGILQAMERGVNQGGIQPRQVTTFPFEVWRYRYLEGIGSDVSIEFVDRSGSGLYTLARDPEEKNVFAYKDPAADVASLNRSDLANRTKDQQFYRTELLAKLAAPPPVRFKDLQEVVTTRVRYHDLPFQATYSVLQVTENSFFVPVTFALPASALQFEPAGDSLKASVDVFLQAANVQKQIVGLTEDTLELERPASDPEQARLGTALYERKLLLKPGRYAIDLVLKDEGSQNLGTWQQLVVIPEPPGGLSLSSLVSADVIRPLSAQESASDAFTVGAHKVVPNVAGEFPKSKQAGLFFQIYGLKIDQATQKPSVEMEVTFSQAEFSFSVRDDLSRFGVVQGDRASVTLSVPLAKFPAGEIQVKAVVKDLLAGETAEASSRFSVVER